jgi:hypothetical protein
MSGERESERERERERGWESEGGREREREREVGEMLSCLGRCLAAGEMRYFNGNVCGLRVC